MSTEMENGTPLISDMFGQMMFLMPNAGVSEHPVKILASQENEQGLTETEAALLERFSGYAGKKGKISPNGLSMKMLRECYQATEALTSLQFSLKWESWGMISNGNCLTQRISEYRRTGSECTLSLILEQKAESKYFLSLAQMKKIVFTSTLSDTGTGTEETRKCSPIVGGVEALDTATGGGRGHHTAIPMFGIDFCVNGKEKNIANTISTRNNVVGVHKFKGDGTAVCVPIGCIDRQGRLGKEVNPKEEAPTLRAQTHGNEPEVCIPVLTPDRAEKRQNGRRFKDSGEESFTLTSQDRHGVAIKGDISAPVIWYDKYKCYIAIRKLTPRECFRLQGWEDKYFERAQFVNSDSQLYKQAGNGVTVAVVEDIARAIGNAR